MNELMNELIVIIYIVPCFPLGGLLFLKLVLSVFIDRHYFLKEKSDLTPTQQ